MGTVPAAMMVSFSNARRGRGAPTLPWRWHAQISLDRIDRGGTRRLLDYAHDRSPGRRQSAAGTAARAAARKPAARQGGGVTGLRHTGSGAAATRCAIPTTSCRKRSVYFDYDSFVVKDEYRPLVEAHARYLQQNRNARVDVQGNTDERGSREYNIALGQKRADAVKRMMTLLGATESQIETVSFGKEKPRTRARRSRVGGEPPRRHPLRRRVGVEAVAARLRCVASGACCSARAPRAPRCSTTKKRAGASRPPTSASCRCSASSRIGSRRSSSRRKAQGWPISCTQLAIAAGRSREAARPDRGAHVRARAAQKRQRDLYVDLDSRLRKIEASPAAYRAGGEHRSARRRNARRSGSPNVGHAAATGRVAAAARPARPALPPPRHRFACDRRRHRAARVRRRARSVQARRLPRRDRGFSAFVKTLSAQPARVVGAILDRQRAVRAHGLSRGDRHAAAVDRRPIPTAARCPTRCSTSRSAQSEHG